MTEKNPRLILPTQEGVPNLEIRRMQRVLEQQRPEVKIHPQTAGEVSRNLEMLLRRTEAGEIRALLAVALLTKESEADCVPIFSSPMSDSGAVAHELLQWSVEWVNHCSKMVGPPPKPAS